MKKKHHMKEGHHSMREDRVSHGDSENPGRPWGHGEFANMPKDVEMVPYPKGGYSSDPHLDDTISRLETDSRDAEDMLRRQKHKSMY